MTHIDFDSVTPLNTSGKIIVTCFPGLNKNKIFEHEILQNTLSVLTDLGCSIIVSLVEDEEFEEICGKNIFIEHINRYGFQWYHLPIVDYQVPDAEFLQNWESVSQKLMKELRLGNKINLHCKGGIGRSGTVAAMLLIELGEENSSAIEHVRKNREGTIENQLQENFVRNFHIK